MDLHELPNLSGWRNVEVWTLEEAAMLWAAIDPMDYIGRRLYDLGKVLPSIQYKKALLLERAVSEAVCSGSLPFVDAWELHDDQQYGPWEKKLEFPEIPDASRIIPHLTRVKFASFMKWAVGKKILSYRQVVQKSVVNIKINSAVQSPDGGTTSVPLALSPPAFLDPSNPRSSPEMRAAVDAWESVASFGEGFKGKSVKSALKTVLNTHPEHKKLSNEAKERISTVANWDRKGGAPKTPGK